MLPMKGGMQTTLDLFNDYLGKVRTESQSYQGVQTCIGITVNNLMEVHLGNGKLLEQIFDSDNINLAYRRVKSNKGSAGIDILGTHQLLGWLPINKEFLIE